MPIQALSLVVLTPVDRPGDNLVMSLTGDPVVPVIPGGWQSVDRPKRRDMTDWKGQTLKTMSLPCMFDGFLANQSVEPDIVRLYKLIEGNGIDPAPVVNVGGLVPLTHLRWVVNSIAWGDYTRRLGDGDRIRQIFTVDLLEYVAPDAVINSRDQSPAQRAAANATATGGTSGSTYTVQQGDTLSSIAASQLHDYNRWQEIADLNGIRDPRSISVGQVIRLP